jgi:hypothetical protein
MLTGSLRDLYRLVFRVNSRAGSLGLRQCRRQYTRECQNGVIWRSTGYWAMQAQLVHNLAILAPVARAKLDRITRSNLAICSLIRLSGLSRSKQDRTSYRRQTVLKI